MEKSKYLNNSSHFIFSYNEKNQTIKYFFGDPLFSKDKNVSIYQLLKSIQKFRIFMDLWHMFEKRNLFRTKQGVILKKLFLAMGENKKIDSKIIRNSLRLILDISSFGTMRQMQKYFNYFASFLPPMYREIIPSMNFNITPRDELVFHCCRPDLYLWRPANSKSNKVLIIYLTKNNSLNMPLAFAHSILATYGISIIYIYNRPKKLPKHFVANYDLTKSIEIIRSILIKFNFKEVYGLGASLGGYKICQLAEGLQMTRVLNFSGNIFHDKSNEKSMARNYDNYNVLSILSLKNDLDKKILDAYKKYHFKTWVNHVDSDVHGTFTSSYLENKLSQQIDWLINGHEHKNMYKI